MKNRKTFWEWRTLLLGALGERSGHELTQEDIQNVLDVLADNEIDGKQFPTYCTVVEKSNFKAGVTYGSQVFVWRGLLERCTKEEIIAALLHEYRHFYRHTQRMNAFDKEHDCDKFAVRLGFGSGMYHLLNRIREDKRGRTDKPAVTNSVSSPTHPHPDKRMEVVAEYIKQLDRDPRYANQ